MILGMIKYTQRRSRVKFIDSTEINPGIARAQHITGIWEKTNKQTHKQTHSLPLRSTESNRLGLCSDGNKIHCGEMK